MTDNASADHLRVGVASVDITPDVGVAMQGYEHRRAEGITDPLLASALAVGQSSINWLLLSVDVIGLDRAFTGDIRETISQSLSLPASAITIVCSHTHSGPATLPHLGPVRSDDEYLQFLKRRLIAVALDAVQKMENARWRFGLTTLNENVNRRVRQGRKILLAANPAGPVDNRLRVLRIDRAGGSSDGSVLALLVHYACHPTSSSGVPRISADWPGAMRSILQKFYERGNEVPVVCFLQGCTGDVTHRIARDRVSWPEHFGIQTEAQSRVLGQLSASAALKASEQSVLISAEAVQAVSESVSFRYHRRRGAEKTEIQLVRIGPPASATNSVERSIWLFGLPGEPFTSYGTELGECLQRQFGTDQQHILVCGYTNDVVGYLCTPAALKEGGYEASVAHEMYHRPAAFSAGTQTLVFNRISKSIAALSSGESRSTTTRVRLKLKQLSQRFALRS